MLQMDTSNSGHTEKSENYFVSEQMEGFVRVQM